MTTIKRKYQGLNTHRFKDNPVEKAFAEEWAKQNEEGKTLAYLLDPNNGQGFLSEPSSDEHFVAATIIQWLGSPVGQSFLEKVGFVPKPKKEKGGPAYDLIKAIVQAYKDGLTLPDIIEAFIAGVGATTHKVLSVKVK